jgi:hypothetical protein
MKTLMRLIAPEWLISSQPNIQKVIEGPFSYEETLAFNEKGYNVYFFPNDIEDFKGLKNLSGKDVTRFNYVFVDWDSKDSPEMTKEQFNANLLDIPTTKIIDSGNGIHAYWKVTDLDPMSYLRLSRRLMRYFHTDPAVGKILQLMRLPETVNTKKLDDPIICRTLQEDLSIMYTCEQLDKYLPPITISDEEYCQQHFNTTYGLNINNLQISDKIPPKFGSLVHENHEAKELWSNPDDRSKSDYRLGHIMFANGFTKEEAGTVLANSAKAITRAPAHRLSYAQNIIDKIWTYEIESEKTKQLSESVASILKRSGDTIKGTAFRCHKRIDSTEHGFRLGQVVGLVAGSGVGKTAFALNMFKWFVEQNPDYCHFFIPLEQPANEIALRWQKMCGTDTSLHNKVHVISNYEEDGSFRHLSFNEIREYLQSWQKNNNTKVGCVVIDHIGALKKKGKDGENQDIMDICHAMKAFAVQTNTLLVMQSQSSREKAGIGDLELNKDAAYGTVYFESYCDYLVTLWQPLKRCHSIESCPTTTAFKFCKIRHKNKKDKIQEDVPYYLYFDNDTELLNDMTQDQKTSFDYFLKQATNKRKADRKTEIVEYRSVPYNEGEKVHVKTNSDKHIARH